MSIMFDIPLINGKTGERIADENNIPVTAIDRINNLLAKNEKLSEEDKITL